MIQEESKQKATGDKKLPQMFTEVGLFRWWLLYLFSGITFLYFVSMRDDFLIQNTSFVLHSELFSILNPPVVVSRSATNQASAIHISWLGSSAQQTQCKWDTSGLSVQSVTYWWHIHSVICVKYPFSTQFHNFNNVWMHYLITMEVTGEHDGLNTADQRVEGK